jgi:hypothetical protein
MEHVEGYLSGKAQFHWPGALVVRLDSHQGELWILRRPGLADVGLGDCFAHARMALDALRRAHKSESND